MTVPADEPQFAALHAQCRAAGVDLMRAMDFQGEPTFVASRWGQFIRLPSLLAVSNWIEVVTGQGRANR